MKLDFIQRSIRISTGITILLAPFLFLYLGASQALGFMAGAFWNIINVFLLSRLLKMFVPSSPFNKKWGAAAGILKFPVLYGAGYVLLRYTNLSPYGIIAGFSLILTVFLLKALGIYLSGSEEGPWVFGNVKK